MRTPTGWLQHTLDDLLRQLPNIKEGTEEGFHQGRVAIRRLREVLPLVQHTYDGHALQTIEDRLRHTARLLGEARDADVMQRLVAHVESRFLQPSIAFASLRLAIADEQRSARRRAIKALPSLDIDSLPDQFRGARRASVLGDSLGSRWRSILRERIAERAGAVRSSIEHAGGVYFPNRLHRLRIAVKRLRYTLELAKATRTWRTPRGIRTLRHVQGVLGNAHDREVLIERLHAETASAATDGRALEQFLRADIYDLHADYLTCRSDVLAVCEACLSDARRSATPRWLVAASVASVAVPSLLLALRPRAETNEDTGVQRRLTIPVG